MKFVRWVKFVTLVKWCALNLVLGFPRVGKLSRKLVFSENLERFVFSVFFVKFVKLVKLSKSEKLFP